MNRNKKLALNSLTSFLLQITTIICGFILPRMILHEYGSKVNGLINSITQFIAIIGFLELGVGAVVQSSLYKPLAEQNNDEISKIIVSANKFFKKLAGILVVYLAVLICIYPFIVKEFDRIYVVTLLGAMSISSFIQYYMGIVDRLLLNADQKGYVQYTVQIIALIANTLICYFLVRQHVSIQLVKLITSLIFVFQPVAIRLYINRYYSINRRIKYDSEPIKQKWNGVAQHIAAVVLDGTDSIVLTLFSTLANVSIYGTYHLVTSGVKSLFMSLTTGFQALLGELWAKQETEQLKTTFYWVEWAIHTGVTFVFGCTASLIVPFVKVYTLGIYDTNYDVPLFALLISLANAMHCLRLPYNIMILAAGHYKQTQHNYIIAAVINIVTSILMVKFLGLIGVAIGTLISMGYQTVWMAWYDSANFIDYKITDFFKHLFADALTFIIAFTCCKWLAFKNLTFISWVILALKTAAIWGAAVLIVNMMLYRQFIKKIAETIKTKFS